MNPEIRETRALPADLEQIGGALAWLEAIADRDDWPARLNFGLGLSLDEVLTNIVSYAFADAPAGSGRIELQVFSTPERIRLLVIDNGTPFDPTEGDPPPLALSLDDAEIGGHGMRLIRHYVDKIAYARVADTNRLTLEAALRGTGAASDDEPSEPAQPI